MSALPKQDLTIGEKFDLSSSGRFWTHRGEWTYETWVKLECHGERHFFQIWIRPDGPGYTLIFGSRTGATRHPCRLYTSAEEAAQWFELLLNVSLSIEQSNGRLWRVDAEDEDESEDDRDVIEVDFEEVHCG